MSVTEMIEELVADCQRAKIDANKFDTGNNAAGTRVRKAMMEIKLAAQEVRNEVSKVKAAR